MISNRPHPNSRSEQVEHLGQQKHSLQEHSPDASAGKHLNRARPSRSRDRNFAERFAHFALATLLVMKPGTATKTSFPPCHWFVLLSPWPREQTVLSLALHFCIYHTEDRSQPGVVSASTDYPGWACKWHNQPWIDPVWQSSYRNS